MLHTRTRMYCYNISILENQDIVQLKLDKNLEVMCGHVLFVCSDAADRTTKRFYQAKPINIKKLFILRSLSMTAASNITHFYFLAFSSDIIHKPIYKSNWHSFNCSNTFSFKKGIF